MKPTIEQMAAALRECMSEKLTCKNCYIYSQFGTGRSMGTVCFERLGVDVVDSLRRMDRQLAEVHKILDEAEAKNRSQSNLVLAAGNMGFALNEIARVIGREARGEG